MFCIKCGQPVAEEDSFCCMCGHPVVPLASKEPDLSQILAPQEEPADPTVPKPRQWAAVITLVLIFAFGLVVFILNRTETGFTMDTAMPWFTVQDGVLYFNDDLYTGNSVLVVPDSINGQTIQEIGDDCFAHSTDLVYIELPETITKIGDSAFYGCSNLRGVKLPESLISIGHYAFGGCTSLEAVCIPYSLEHVGGNPFYNCHKLQFFFYPGPADEWYELPLGNLREDAYVYCADGVRPAA